MAMDLAAAAERAQRLLAERSEAEKAACAGSLAVFARRAWPVLEPGTELR